LIILSCWQRKNPHQYRNLSGINAGSVVSANGGGRNKRLMVLAGFLGGVTSPENVSLTKVYV
jgi:hypothetical protein